MLNLLKEFVLGLEDNRGLLGCSRCYHTVFALHSLLHNGEAQILSDIHLLDNVPLLLPYLLGGTMCLALMLGRPNREL